MLRKSIQLMACENFERGVRPAAVVTLIAAAMLLFARGASAVDWPEQYFNPTPSDDDVALPMPCGGAMAFRKVFVPDQGPLNDYPISVGGTDTGRGSLENVRPEHIAGSFQEGEERYYLLGKYEVNRLQYSALKAPCAEPALAARLPQTAISWFDAVAFADSYSRWLREHAPTELPKEGKEAGFARLPTEVEWEFAARGGTAVSQADFTERAFPMPEGIVRYVWFSGPESANGKAQFIGLLKPNPLGFHDVLGNVDEMVFEPFRLNRLNRLHGQAGGYIVRGGNYFTAEHEIRTAYRQEVPYYKRKAARVSKTTGFRLAIVAPVITSRARLKSIAQAWSELGSVLPQHAVATLEGEALDDPVKELDVIAEAAVDPNMKKRLKSLNAVLRANIQGRDDQQKLAAKASLRLGAFLCQKLFGDGRAVDALAGIVNDRREAFGDEDARLNRYQTQLDEEQALLDSIFEYYIETLLNSTSIYDEVILRGQLMVLVTELKRKGYDSVILFVDQHYRHLAALINDPGADRAEWLQQCKSVGLINGREKR